MSRNPAPAALDDRSQPAKTQWVTLREAGTVTGIHFLHLLNKYLGRRVFSLALYPVALYFSLCKPAFRKASLDFLTTHYRFYPQQWHRPPTHHDVLKHFHQFGEAILDKSLAWSKEFSEDEFILADQQVVDDLLHDSRGQIIIGTHLGNLEYCRGFIQRSDVKTINILIYERHAANFAQAMATLNEDSRLHVYQVDELDIATILHLRSKLAQGEWLFIAGDRVPVSGLQRTVTVDFLGRKAALPIGPYMLAKTLGCPVKLMFSYRLGDKIYFEAIPFAEQITLTRAQRNVQLQRYAQRFAQHLERNCRQVPFQWFNFYDFWSQNAPASNSSPESPDR